MEFTDVVRRRRMVRGYDPTRPVPRAVLDAMLDLATRAPSAGFSQGWDFLVLTEPADRHLFWATTAQATPDGSPDDGPAGDPAAGDAPLGQDAWLVGMRNAPALILCLSDKERYLDRYAEPDKGWADRDENRWPVPYWDLDTAMAAMVMLLSIVDQGLAGCFFGIPADRTSAVLDAFSVPRGRGPVGVISVGYPAADRRSPSLRRGRRPVTEVAHDGRFGTPWTSA